MRIKKDGREWGTGRIYERERSPFWWIAYCHRGKEISESTKILKTQDKDKSEAERVLKHRLKELGAEDVGAALFIPPRARKLSVNKLIDALESSLRVEKKLSAPTRTRLLQVRKAFGTVGACDLSCEAIDLFIEQQLAKGAAPASVNRCTQLLGQAFRLAYKRGRILRAPYIRRLSEVGNERRGFASEKEVRSILQHLPKHVADILLAGFLTGWRRGEIQSLLWSEIDGDVIRLRPLDSKNGCGRVLVLVGELRELIERRRQARVSNSDLVFHRGDGRPIVDFRKSWATACRKAGVPDLLFHDLRRTAVRDMIRAGVAPKIAMMISGHKTQSMLDRYNSVAEDELRAAQEKTAAYRREQFATKIEPRPELSSMRALGTVQ